MEGGQRGDQTTRGEYSHGWKLDFFLKKSQTQIPKYEDPGFGGAGGISGGVALKVSVLTKNGSKGGDKGPCVSFVLEEQL